MMLARWFVYGLLALSLSFAESSFAATSPKKKTSLCKRALRTTAAIVVLPFVISGGARVFYSTHAALQGKTHIGQGIYLEKEYFDEYLNSQELQKPNDHELSIAKKLTKLFDDEFESSEAKAVRYFPAPRDASTFVDGKPEGGGVCRHKACIISGLLDSYGIENEIYSAISLPGLSSDQGHAFIYLPQHDAIFDPVTKAYGDSMESLKTNPYFDDKIMRSDKTLFNGTYRWIENGVKR